MTKDERKALRDEYKRLKGIPDEVYEGMFTTDQMAIFRRLNELEDLLGY